MGRRHSKRGVALRLGSLIGVGEGSAKVRQGMSALDRPGQVKFHGAASFFLSRIINIYRQATIVISLYIH